MVFVFCGTVARSTLITRGRGLCLFRCTAVSFVFLGFARYLLSLSLSLLYPWNLEISCFRVRRASPLMIDLYLTAEREHLP